MRVKDVMDSYLDISVKAASVVSPSLAIVLLQPPPLFSPIIMDTMQHIVLVEIVTNFYKTVVDCCRACGGEQPQQSCCCD